MVMWIFKEISQLFWGGTQQTAKSRFLTWRGDRRWRQQGRWGSAVCVRGNLLSLRRWSRPSTSPSPAYWERGSRWAAGRTPSFFKLKALQRMLHKMALSLFQNTLSSLHTKHDLYQKNQQKYPRKSQNISKMTDLLKEQGRSLCADIP